METRVLTDEEWKHRETEMCNAVYASSVVIFERMERAGEISGNGHHAAQILAEKAVQDLRARRWKRD